MHETMLATPIIQQNGILQTQPQQQQQLVTSTTSSSPSQHLYQSTPKQPQGILKDPKRNLMNNSNNMQILNVQNVGAQTGVAVGTGVGVGGGGGGSVVGVGQGTQTAATQLDA